MKIPQLRQTLRFLVEKQVDHLLGSEDAELARAELTCLTHQLTQDVVNTPSVLSSELLAPDKCSRARTGCGPDSRGCACASSPPSLSAEKPFTVMRVRSFASVFLNSASTAALVLLVVHVDEIHDDDAAEVPQPQLPGDRLCCFEVGLEDGVVEITAADEAAGVHVHRGQCLSLVDDQISRRTSGRRAAPAPLDLVFHHAGRTADVRRHNARAGRRRCWCYSRAKPLHFLEGLARIHPNVKGFPR